MAFKMSAVRSCLSPVNGLKTKVSGRFFALSFARKSVLMLIAQGPMFIKVKLYATVELYNRQKAEGNLYKITKYC